jgi:hypothetical protein
MDRFEKIMSIFIAIALFGILVVLVVDKIEIKDVKTVKFNELNIKDRENGICADMYAEGFEWGFAQHKINWQTEHWKYNHNWSKEKKAMAWYEFWEKIIDN